MRPRLHHGLSIVFLAVFALLATFAPGGEGLPLGNGAEQYVSVPPDPRSDTSGLVRATLSIAEEMEEEADEEGSTLVAIFSAAKLARHAAYGAGEAFLPPLDWLTGHFSTGPPVL